MVVDRITPVFALVVLILVLALLVFLRYHRNPETRWMFVELVGERKRTMRVLRLLSWVALLLLLLRFGLPFFDSAKVMEYRPFPGRGSFSPWPWSKNSVVVVTIPRLIGFWHHAAGLLFVVLSFPTGGRRWTEHALPRRSTRVLRVLRWLIIIPLLYAVLSPSLDPTLDGPTLWTSCVYFLFALLCYLVVRPTRGEYGMHPCLEEMQDFVVGLVLVSVVCYWFVVLILFPGIVIY